VRRRRFTLLVRIMFVLLCLSHQTVHDTSQ
jgi:hypothetical protein